MTVSALLLSLLIAAEPVPAARGAWRDFFNEVRTEQVPRDVRKFVIDAQGCGHFSGEADPSNPPERTASINKAMKNLCTGLPQKRHKLLAKYPKDTVATGVIAAVWEDYGFEE